MKEDFLLYIWQQQYFEKKELRTVQGQTLSVIDPGIRNLQAGPDFHQGRVRLGKKVWIGDVEIHIKSSEWYTHHHHKDIAYDQIILHVVWDNDKEVRTNAGRYPPTLELKHRIRTELLIRQNQLLGSNLKIPCQAFVSKIDPRHLKKMIRQSINQRLNSRSSRILNLLQRNDHDWDQVAYLSYATSFGYSVNCEPFGLLARLVPLCIVRKIRSNLFQLEALFFGQAGFLERVNGDSYYQKMQSEFFYLKEKYKLPTGIIKLSMWKYLRLRPANFPSVRIAQFAAFMQTSNYRFSNVRELDSANCFAFEDVQVSSYWKSYYDFGKPGGGSSKMGNSFKNQLIVNTVVPLLAAYGKYLGRGDYLNHAEMHLAKLPAERNHILTHWRDLGFEVSSAFDSQAILELYRNHCMVKKCLDCEIGKSLLKIREPA